MNRDDEGEFEEWLQRAYRYALSLCHDRAAAEDLVQEASLRVAERGGPWDVSYLMRVVRSGFVRRRRREELAAAGVEEASHDVADELARALARLSGEEREALYLSAVEGRSAADIARLTGRPRGTILGLLYRSKEKVRRMLESGGVSI